MIDKLCYCHNMNISMYMLERWLAPYHPISEIVEGKRTIGGARLFEESPQFGPDFLYVGQTRDFFKDSTSSCVMMMHRNDVISVESFDLNAVFNQVLLAFEFYNDIERRLMSASLKQHPEQEVISTVEKLLGPTFIMKRDFRILACSQNFNGQHVNRFWDHFVQNREASLDSLETMRTSVVINEVLNRQPSMLEFREPEAAPFDFGLANTYRRQDGSVIGHLIIASDRATTPFEHDIAAIIMEALEAAQSIGTANAQPALAGIGGDALLANLLSGADPYSARMLAVLTGIKAATPLRILAVQLEEDNMRTIVRDSLAKRIGTCVMTDRESRICVAHDDGGPSKSNFA